jgi:hypothetical protein
MTPPDLSNHPLCKYFLSSYLSKGADQSNFPDDQFPSILDRYEKVFQSALEVLGVTKERLKKRTEFNFDSGDPANLEGGIAMLRVIEALRLAKFHKISLVKTPKNSSGADLVCEKNSHRICCEVKAITKQSSARPGFFMEDQLYEKILESISKARTQLEATAALEHCSVKIFACVINWFDQSIYLTQDDYQRIVNKLENNQEQQSLIGIDGVLFVTKMGQWFLFLTEHGKCIDG